VATCLGESKVRSASQVNGMVPKSAKFRKFFICHSQATLVVYKNREENPLSRETTGSPKEVKDTLVVFRI